MASFEDYDDYLDYKRPSVHTKSQLYRRNGDLSQYGGQRLTGSMRTVNTVNMLKSKENRTVHRQERGGLYLSDNTHYSSPGVTDSQSKMAVSYSNHNRGVLRRRRPDHDSSERTQDRRKMNDNRGLVPLRDLRTNVGATPRIESTGSQGNLTQRDAGTGKQAGGLSGGTRLDVLTRNRQLLYVETVWTKKRLEKLRASGYGDAILNKRLKAAKEEKRWDLIMRFAQQDSRSVNILWDFLKSDFPKVFSVLKKEYQNILRNHFKPQIANLQTTPANANRMLDILVGQSEEQEERMCEMERSLEGQAATLEEVRRVLEDTRRVVFEWGGREVTEEDQDMDIKETSQQVLDTILVVTREKEQQMEQHRTANEELRKKAAKLTKAKREK